MIGERFNRWTIIRQVKGPKRGKHFECHCDCGYVKIINAYALKKGKTKQCQLCQKKSLIMTGEFFGKWQVIKEITERTSWGARQYLCQCNCGAMKILAVGDLRLSKSTQCVSCHITEKNISHGLSHTRTYRIWAGIIDRCLNANNKSYNYYGGRGIKICESWKNFQNFIKDMDEVPPGMEIDRIDPDGNYEIDNCRWVTRQENVANRRMSAQNRDKYLLVNIEGLCKICSINNNTISDITINLPILIKKNK